MKTLIGVAALLLLASMAWANSRTVTLEVSGMTCSTCPIVVKKALAQVDGVAKVTVSLKKKEAVVTFDDEKTSVDALTTATTNAGFPSKQKT
jgi:mercuric ion binding protein